MFETVTCKIERAEYFVQKLRTEPIGTLAWRACLEAFFFELGSAKDFFLQAINDKYGLGLKRDEATKTDLLKKCLGDGGHADALEVVKSIEKRLSKKYSWLWKINNYRNSATHRELLAIGYVAEMPVSEDLFNKLQRGEATVRLILPGEKKVIPPDVPKVVVPLRAYLFKDPEDRSQGNANMEVIPYCEQSLDKLRDFLVRQYSKLS
jgi:hypothetical protein